MLCILGWTLDATHGSPTPLANHDWEWSNDVVNLRQEQRMWVRRGFTWDRFIACRVLVLG